MIRLISTKHMKLTMKGIICKSEQVEREREIVYFFLLFEMITITWHYMQCKWQMVGSGHHHHHHHLSFISSFVLAQRYGLDFEPISLQIFMVQYNICYALQIKIDNYTMKGNFSVVNTQMLPFTL